MAALHGAEQDGTGQSGLADACVADEDEVCGAPDEVEFVELFDLSLADAGLLFPREGLQRPALWQVGAVDAVLEKALLLALVLPAQDARDKFGVARLPLFGAFELVADNFPKSSEFEVLE